MEPRGFNQGFSLKSRVGGEREEKKHYIAKTMPNQFERSQYLLLTGVIMMKGGKFSLTC